MIGLASLETFNFVFNICEENGEIFFYGDDFEEKFALIYIIHLEEKLRRILNTMAMQRLNKCQSKQPAFWGWKKLILARGSSEKSIKIERKRNIFCLA